MLSSDHSSINSYQVLCAFTIIALLLISRPFPTVASLPNDIDVNDIDAITLHRSPYIQYANGKHSENHKPMFTKCDKYKPTVKEQQPRGTPVIQVHAENLDPENNKGGKVTYKIVQREGERAYFTINEQTGDINTNFEFDRDEPFRQKELYLTVQATDDGRPPLADICTFKLTVTDINDNAPSFDQMNYTAQVSKDLKEKSEVIRVFAYDVDEGENSRLTYSFLNDTTEFNEYFRIDPATGVVYLKKSLLAKEGFKFSSTVIVQDNGDTPNKAASEISIFIVSSDKHPPRILSYKERIEIPENFYDFDIPLINITAESNIPDESIAFELVKGKTTQTNKDQTFVLNPISDISATITLARTLDYETVTEYQLTVRVHNKDLLGSSVNIIVSVKDVNDEIPTFIELLRGSVVENDVIGAQAMQVRAIDKDGTSPNNLVTYELLNHNDLFKINGETGVITAIAVFDRERENLYHVLVKAFDGAPSALLKHKEPNSATQTFQISIEDQNDNKPEFVERIYDVQHISEGADRLKDVVEVKAVDKDDASLIAYSIINGNIDEAFLIEETTGRIKVNSKLDFEKIEVYNLTIRAFDGIFEDYTNVIIRIRNENDEPPIFYPYNKTILLKEESISDDCIITLEAYDPDIKDRTADQHIVYRVAKEHQSFLDVTVNGCVLLIKKLDRDEPNGAPEYQGYIYAHDNDGGTNSLSKSAEINIVLIDINDNAPILNISEIVWYENEQPGIITTLSAIDYDTIENGPPFNYEIVSNSNYDIFNQFSIVGKELVANTVFDREVQKMYIVNIKITDSGSPSQSGVSRLHVIIGDRNDNEAQDGASEIFVYKYETLRYDIAIGRVYVNDPDDWDLNDKLFQANRGMDINFSLSSDDTGMILMTSGTPEGTYFLTFNVTEQNLPNILPHLVHANVTVTVRNIYEDVVRKSGSVRLQGVTIEEFIHRHSEVDISRKDAFQQYVANILNVSFENVDVFTVLQSPYNQSTIDIRFSAHGSPYYAPEKLNSKVALNQIDFESKIQAEFVMVGISECLEELVCPLRHSCSSVLNIKNEPAVVYTNRTSFVGVKAIVEPVCDCVQRIIGECFSSSNDHMETAPDHDDTCTACSKSLDSEQLGVIGINLNGDGWALYPTFDACNHTEISLSILPQTENGLIFYIGPLSGTANAYISKDFMSLELKDSFVVLKLDLGYGPLEIVSNYTRITMGTLHKIRISFTPEDVQIEVDECPSYCLTWTSFVKPGLLNVNGPLQVGGLVKRISNERIKNSLFTTANVYPTSRGFIGWIGNFTYNSYVYNLGAPSDSYRVHIKCNYSVMQAVTFGIDSNFLVAIFVCIAILFVLLLAVVIHRRRHDSFSMKDVDDTRENIINYEDEGGGECDTNFDLSVLGPRCDEKPSITATATATDNFYYPGIDLPADIGGFLDTKKMECDRNPENFAYDDVRHYGYEGDGNTSGSLSSLASCTDDGDLKFNYLSSFGPRFRKLADMYGDDGSEEGSQHGEESWC